MRILMYTETALPKLGGQELVVDSLAREFVEAGHEVRIPVRLSDLVRDGDISQNVAMRPGDTLIIPTSWF